MSEALKQVSERVWFLPAHPEPEKVQPTVGVVIGSDETVLVDAGNTPATAKLVTAELDRIGAPPVAKVVYTHHHWDHVFGACVYGVEAVSHSLCKQLLEEEAEKPWGLDFLEAELERDGSLEEMTEVLKKGVQDWSAFEIVVPTTTFDDQLTLEGDGYCLELEHVGGRHAQDSIVVSVVGESVMFLGDSFYPPPLRLNPTDTNPDTAMLRRFLETGYETLIDGHSEPFPRAELEAWLASNAS